MKKLSKIIGIIQIIITGLIFIVMIDGLIFDSRHGVILTMEQDCDFIVPKEYKIITNGKYFAVAFTACFGGKYEMILHERPFHGTDWNYTSIVKPCLFYTECQAKSYLKAYLIKLQEQNKSKISGYK